VRTRSGFGNAAADKIWNDHLGNNAFVWHRNQCVTCLEAYHSQPPVNTGCIEGLRILEAVIDEVLTKIDEVRTNQN
jgi:hypothetical protein